ncbi:DUF2004 domain-containing protein [Chitinophaga sp. S165]|uniref:DUF2004 domain-containing protein n=1 Tax=Chitinophaga sp. S165 TaxID=2135462 RepID=UPI000D71A06E|nr:DUF2004 domain-containing protein [Chitinophaga sp. S165]PWV56384.1 uncharacterized protein DUF2004 [Chitinophaga sp. S165]
MPQFELPYFGMLDSDAVDNYYEAEASIAGNPVQVDLNFENESVSADVLNNVKQFLLAVEQHLPKCKEYILNEYKNGEIVQEYIQYHKDDMSEGVLCDELGIKGGDIDQQLVAKLQPVRIGIYPESENYITFGYSFSNELTPSVLEITANKNIELQNMYMEY